MVHRCPGTENAEVQKEDRRKNSLLAQGPKVADPGLNSGRIRRRGVLAFHRETGWAAGKAAEKSAESRQGEAREGRGEGPPQGGGASEAPRELAERWRNCGGTRAQRGTTFAQGGAGTGRVPGTPLPPPAQTRHCRRDWRPGGRVEAAPGYRRRCYGRPAACRQDRRSVARSPPLVLCAQLRLGALAVRKGRGQGRLGGGGGRPGRIGGSRERGCATASLALPTQRPCAALAWRKGARAELPTPPPSRKSFFCRAGGCVLGVEGAPGTFRAWGERLRSRAPQRAGFWRGSGVFPGLCPAPDSPKSVTVLPQIRS